jgi:hypothetical protein
MDLEPRIRRLEAVAASLNPSQPQSPPTAWLDIGPDGRLRGPMPGERSTQGERKTFEQMGAMDAATAPYPET